MSLNDVKVKALMGQGYKGSCNDMEYQFWLNGGASSVLPSAVTQTSTEGGTASYRQEAGASSYDVITSEEGTQVQIVASDGSSEVASTYSVFDDGQVVLNLQSNGPDIVLALNGVPAETGTETATLGSTAPVAGLTVTKWLYVVVDGEFGYIPFFKAP